MAETASPIRLNSTVETARLSLKPDPASGLSEIVDTQTDQVLGTVKHPVDSHYEVELFYGKGGFMGSISSPGGLRYFGLPGSEIRVGGVELLLDGEPIVSSPNKRARKTKLSPPQEVTDQAMILGAGLATRFERISGQLTRYSKPGVPLAGERSVIECIADSLADAGFTHLLVNTCCEPDSVKTGLSRSRAERIDYIDEEAPSGTAGGLRKMLTNSNYTKLLDQGQPLLVVQGDSVTDADFSALMEAHVAHNALVTIGCQLVDEEDVDKFGIIVTDTSGEDGQSGCITGFQEKPPRHLAQSRLGNTGFYIFSPRAYAIITDVYVDLLVEAQAQAIARGESAPQEIPLDFASDIFPAVLERVQRDPGIGKFWAQSVECYWSDIGNPKQYVQSIHDIYAGKINLALPEKPEQYYKDGIIFWDSAAAIAAKEGAALQGNVVVALPFRSA